MDIKTKEKIAKVYELVQRGVDGEKDAAKEALDRLMEKYNLNESDIEISLRYNEYRFKYSNRLEMMLFVQLKVYFLSDLEVTLYRDTYKVREMVVKLEYLDYVVLNTAYEYFKRHMKEQFKIHCSALIKRCRTTRTRNARRRELQEVFFNQYVIASKLYKPSEIKKIKPGELSAKERKDMQQLSSIEGGQYHTQVNTGLYLNQ